VGAAVLVFAGVVPGQASNIAIGARASTLGFGAEMTGRLSKEFNIRAALHPLPSFSYTGTESDVEYEFDIQLLSAMAGLDWHPGGGGFHLSGGLLLNRNKVDANGRAAGSYDIGGRTYSGAQVGSLRGKLTFKDLAPYAGLGFGNAVNPQKKIGIGLDLGVVFSGSPTLDLTASGPISGDAQFQRDLDQEERDAQDDLSQFKVYPIVSVSITYRF
jgi:hypothetical protein